MIWRFFPKLKREKELLAEYAADGGDGGDEQPAPA